MLHFHECNQVLSEGIMAIKTFIRKVIPFSVRQLLNPLQKFFLHPSYRQRALYVKTSKTKPVNENMIFYEAYHGDSMTGNPYAVFTYLLEDPKYQHLQHVWALVDESHVPSSIRFHPRVRSEERRVGNTFRFWE